MKCNIIFSNSTQSIGGETVLHNPTFTFSTKYMPTLYSLGLTITFSDFDKLDGNVFGFSIVNTKTTDVVYATEMNELMPPVEKANDSLTLNIMLNNIDIQNELPNKVFVFVNDKIIGESEFVVRKDDDYVNH